MEMCLRHFMLCVSSSTNVASAASRQQVQKAHLITLHHKPASQETVKAAGPSQTQRGSTIDNDMGKMQENSGPWSGVMS